MKNSTKIIIGVIVVILAVAIGALIWFLTRKSDYKITDDVKLDQVTITNITIEYKDNLSTYRGVVTARKDVSIEHIVIEAYDKDDNKVQFVGYVNKDLKKDEKVDIVSSIDKDITGYKKITYKVKEKN